MSYAPPMHTKHALWVLLGGLAAGCGNDYVAADTPEVETDTEGQGTTANPTGVSAGWDDETTDGEGSGDGGGGCGSGPACSGSTPFCVEGDCVGCDAVDQPDAACAALDPAAPLCGDGGCVECGPLDTSLCFDDAPVCGDDGSCRGCVDHDECDTACDLETGRCFDEAVVIGEDGIATTGAISALLDTTDPGARIAVRIAPGTQCVLDTLLVDDGRALALLGEPGERPCLTSWDDRAAITVADGSALYLLDVRIEESYGVAVEARGASIHVERSELVNNSGGALAVSQDAYLRLRNSMVGCDRNNVAVVSTHSSTVDVSYATVVAGFGSAQGIVCEGDNAVTVRNSIVVSEASLGEIDCPEADVRFSALEAVFGEGNVAVGAVDTGRWFVDYARGDLHLQGDALGMPFEGVGVWTEIDPLVDLDGDPRPAVVDAQDWVGADIP